MVKNLSELPLELRLEYIKRLGNLQFKLLQCVYDRRSIAERYVNGEVILHVHGLASNNRFCATWRRRDDDWATSNYKVPVFVRIGQVSEELRPIASIARLQPLDCCNMYIADAFEKGISPSPETIFRILDRKLCSIYDLVSIEASQLVDEVIQSSPQVIDNLSDKNTDNLGNWLNWNGCSAQNAFDLATIWKKEGSWLALSGSTITYCLTEGIGPTVQIRQVFPCPSSPLISAIQWMHMLYPTQENEHEGLCKFYY